MEVTIRVALCDDARAIKTLLRHVLEEDGDMEVVSVTGTGGALLAELGRHHPDVLLLDLLLPDVPDPGELIRRLRDESPDMTILLLSNLPPDRLAAEAQRHRADGWLVKAQKPEQLRAAVRRAVAPAAP